MSPGQTTIISLEKVVVPDTTTFLTIVLGDGDGPMVVVVVVYPEIVISPPTPIQLLTDGVIEGVIGGVGVIEIVGVGEGTSQSKYAVKSNILHGLVVVVVVLHEPLVNTISHKSGQMNVDGDGPEKIQAPPKVSAKHQIWFVES